MDFFAKKVDVGKQILRASSVVVDFTAKYDDTSPSLYAKNRVCPQAIRVYASLLVGVHEHCRSHSELTLAGAFGSMSHSALRYSKEQKGCFMRPRLPLFHSLGLVIIRQIFTWRLQDKQRT